MNGELPKCKHGIIAKACADCAEIYQLKAELDIEKKRVHVALYLMEKDRAKLAAMKDDAGRIGSMHKIDLGRLQDANAEIARLQGLCSSAECKQNAQLPRLVAYLVHNSGKKSCADALSYWDSIRPRKTEGREEGRNEY